MTEVMPLLLIVEDETQMRKFLRASLSSHGYRLVEAINGTEGLSQAASYNPDLVLLDLGLPDLDGLDVTKRLREWSTAPIIVISARGQEDDKINALDAGADDYLTKPFGTGELMARIRVALRHASAHRSSRCASSFSRPTRGAACPARACAVASFTASTMNNSVSFATPLSRSTPIDRV